MIINNSVSMFYWYTKIYQNIKIKEWHYYTGNKSLPRTIIYPYNKKSLYKGTIYEYAPIKEFKKKFKYYDENEILKIAGYKSFELLWKMGLYKLSISSKYFNKKGNFQKRFGLPKSFLKFMVENDLNFEEYKILQLIQEPNISLIEKLYFFNYDYLCFMNKQGYIRDLKILSKYRNHESEIRTICQYMPLRKFLGYDKGVKNLDLYIDYLSILKKLNYKMKSKKELFPKQLKAMHDKLMKKLKIQQDFRTEFGAYLRFLELSKYIYDDDKYIIFPAPSVEDLIDEGQQQNNCVSRLYLEPYINKQTEIFFIRKIKNINKSCITLEFKNQTVRQKKLADNDSRLSKEQEEFIKKWEGIRKFRDRQEKYKLYESTNIKKYDLIKKVA